MYKFTFLVVLLLAACAVNPIHAAADVEIAWQEYLEKFPMGIQTKAEYGKSKSNFERIHSVIEEHNADPTSTYKMGHNEFSVLDVEERQKYLLNNTRPSTKSLYEEFGFETQFDADENDDLILRNLPTSIDYRNHTCMQPVKNQGRCGSCSAFAATAVVEFAQCIKTGTPVNLSEQQIVDCDFPDRQCGGGSYHEYWRSLIRAGGQALSAYYPYVSGGTRVRGRTCKKMEKGAKLAASNPIIALKSRDELGVMKLLAKEKVVAVCVSVTDKFMYYRSGVYTTPCKGNEGLHAIAAVGYGTTDKGIKYWNRIQNVHVNLFFFREMGKFAFVPVLVMMALLAVHAADDLEVAWQKYLAEFPVGVQTKAELGMRKSIFNETHTEIVKHNSQEGISFELAHNAFSVMTEEEKQQRMGAFKPVPPSNVIRGVSTRALPTTVEYRTSSCMPTVKNQGSCGSCWAHSATAVVEFGQCKKYGGSSLNLSEQQLVDCSRDNGCSGGWEHEAWEYLASNGGQTDESSYPYTATAGTCQFSSWDMTIGAEISSSNPVEWIASKDTTAMMTALADGRILSIYMQMPSTLFNYKSGVFNDVNCVANNAHAMNVVGYGTLNCIDYWVVRNSWGSGWGASGYILVKRGVDLCMIESYARTTNIA
uniref:Uncharacterized protein n=1 Tax=Daphnia galeata TaxID=27404 RepID=A0A8J2RR21_9CRUS|nr:unnamed protein product [Daphnia galeata]